MFVNVLLWRPKLKLKKLYIISMTFFLVLILLNIVDESLELYLITILFRCVSILACVYKKKNITSFTIPPFFVHCLNISALTQAGRCTQLSSVFVGLCWRRMLHIKCSPALWVTESKEAPRHRGLNVFLPFVSQSVLEQCRSAGGWLGGLLEQLIHDNMRSSPLWITALLGSEEPPTSHLFVLAYPLSSRESIYSFTCFSEKFL